MQIDVAPGTTDTFASELRTWRHAALNILLVVMTITGAPIIVIILAQAVRHPEQRLVASAAYLVVYLGVVGLAAFQRLNYRTRAWGLVLLGYLTGVLALALGGLAGDGRVLLVATPLVALALIGARAGLIVTFLNLTTFAGFAVAAHLGWLDDWLVISDNPLDLMSWLFEGAVVGLSLAGLVTLQLSLNRFLANIAAEKARLLEIGNAFKNRYQIISELASDYACAYRIESDGTLVHEWVTDAFTPITGYAPSALDAQGGWAEIVHPDDKPAAIQHLQNLLSGEPDEVEVRIITKDGSIRWVRHHGRPMWDEAEGRVVQIYSAVQDITERKQAEKELQESAETVQALLNASSEPSLLLNIDGTIAAMNNAAAKNLGETPDELVGKSIFDLLPPEIAEYRKTKANEVARSGKPARFEDCRAGRWFDHSIYPVFDAEGKTIRLAIFARETTERKRAEEQAAQAERLTAMGQIGAALAHEINNPLQAVESSLGLALDRRLEQDERWEFLQHVSRQVKQIKSLMGQVMHATRSSDPDRQAVNVNEVVNRALRLTSVGLRDNCIQAQVELPDDLPPVFASSDNLVQVLLNLITNAMDAMPDGGKLSITAQAVEQKVELTIADTGPGIPAHALGRLFEPFYTTKEDSVGLGLFISRSIIHQQGGTITAENGPDGGAIFKVTLPQIPLENQLTKEKSS